VNARVRGVLAAFAAFGAFWGAWGVLLPDIKDRTDASVSALGVALLFIAFAALPAMLATGALVDRVGAAVLPASLALFGAAVILPGVVHSVWQLAIVLLVVGAFSGAVDVAINASATAIEASEGVRLMQKAHALFSAGFLVAAVFVGVAREVGAPPLPILGAIGAVVVAVAVANRTGEDVRVPRAPRRRRLRLSRTVLLLGVLCAVAFVVESGIENWSALFLETELDASPAVSGLGPGLFAAAMTLGRTLGHRLEARLGDRGLLAGGALLAAGGLGVAAVAPVIPVALAGFFLGGAGISVAAPTLFGAAGRGSVEQERGSAVAAVTTISYLGFLGGPPLIGGVSGALDLRGGVAMLAGIAVLVAVVTASLAGDALPLRRPQHPSRGEVR
jgi:MFS family permease